MPYIFCPGTAMVLDAGSPYGLTVAGSLEAFTAHVAAVLPRCRRAAVVAVRPEAGVSLVPEPSLASYSFPTAAPGSCCYVSHHEALCFIPVEEGLDLPGRECCGPLRYGMATYPTDALTAQALIRKARLLAQLAVETGRPCLDARGVEEEIIGLRGELGRLVSRGYGLSSPQVAAVSRVLDAFVLAAQRLKDS